MAVTLGQHACIYVAAAAEWHCTSRHACCIGSVVVLPNKVSQCYLAYLMGGGVSVKLLFSLIFNGPGGGTGPAPISETKHFFCNIFMRLAGLLQYPCF